MIHPLDGVNLKVEQARKHFQDLDQMLKSFLKANPYQITREFDVSLGENVFRVVESPKEIPLEIGIIAGDMVYNFRSALDILANRLVEANGSKPSRSTAFPIFEKPEGWNSRSANKVAGMSAHHIALIKSEQPCFAQNPQRGQFLWYLEDVCNGDKHRNIILVAAGTIGGGINLPFPVQHDKIFFHNGPVEKGTIICRVPGQNVDMYLGYLPDVAFSKTEPAAGVSLKEFYHTINYIVPNIILNNLSAGYMCLLSLVTPAQSINPSA
jgi:hypothetical protein